MEHAGNERENKKDNGSRGKTGRPKTALQHFNLYSEIFKKKDKREILLTLKNWASY